MTTDNDNTSSAAGAALYHGWDEEEAERLAPGKPLYMAQIRQEHMRWDEDAWMMDPEDTGVVNYEEFFFARLEDAELWVDWQLAQWPTVVEDSGDVLHACGEIDRVVFPKRDPAWPRRVTFWDNQPGFEGRLYGAVTAELRELAIRRATNPSSPGA
jgi:hypothetical protein